MLYLIPYIKINSKWVIYLNIRAKTIKLLEQHIGLNLHDFELGSDFLETAPNAQQMKNYINGTLSEIELLCFKAHHQESDNTTHRMGEHFCKSSIR